MRILVTGASGFFGSWLVPELEAQHEVVPFDLVEGQDILNAKALAGAMKGCDAVVHMAALPHYRDDIPAQAFIRLNIIGTARVVAAMRKAKTKNLVYISSGALYGFGPGRSLEGWVTPPIEEGDETDRADWDMIDAYGASKLACEEWLEATAPRGWCVTSLRINCIEPHHHGAVDSGAHWGWWCSQDTAALAVEAALVRNKTGFCAVNVGEPNENLDATRLGAMLLGAMQA